MQPDPTTQIHALSDRETRRELRRRVDDHNRRVMETGRFEAERMQIQERDQFKNAVVVITAVLAFVGVISALIFNLRGL